MKKLITILAMAACAAAITGCSVKKIEYEKKADGQVSYRIYENDHWLKTEASGLRGGMKNDGTFEFSAEGMKSSPSEEFNRTMQTYTTAFVQLAQIAAAAYNPSASQAVATAAKSTSSTSATPTVVVNTQQAETKETTATNGTAATNSSTPTQNSNSQSATDRSEERRVGKEC